MGGYNPGMIKGDTYLEDVWGSEDGVTWTEATDSNVHFHFAQRVNYTFWRRDPGNQWMSIRKVPILTAGMVTAG